MDYNYLFIWVGVMALTTSAIGRYTTENGYLQRKVSREFAILVFVPLLYFVVTASQRYWGDYYLYMYNFRNYPVEFDEAVDFVRSRSNSYLFYTSGIFLKMFISENETVYRAGLALIHIIPIMILIRKYSDNFMLSIYLVLATGIPLAWMLNGVRQFCAAAIIYMATPLMIDKKYFKLLLVLIIAALFHQSAILMIPVVIVCQGKAWNWKTILAIIGAVGLTYIFASFSGSSDEMLEYAGYSAEIYASDDGVHPLRVAVSAVPVVLALMARTRIEDENSPIINLCTNMSIMSLGVNLVGMVTSGILIGRIPIYMNLYNFILLPYLLKRLFSGKMYKIMLTVTVAMYGLYYYVQYI